MRVKLLRSLGVPLLKELGLYAAGDDRGSNAVDFVENAVVEVDKKDGEELLKRKIAKETSEAVGPPPIQAVPQVVQLQAVPPAPATFNQLHPQGRPDPAPSTEAAEDAIKDAKKK